MLQFETTIELGGKTATGLRVPEKVIAALGKGKRPPVLVTIGSHTYRSTVAVMDGEFWLPLSAENRELAGVAAGDQIEVTITFDPDPREVTIPHDLQAALDHRPEAKAAFEKLSYSNKQRYVMPIEDAKTEETRARRIAKTIDSLLSG